jgi:hypothetical protein
MACPVHACRSLPINAPTLPSHAWLHNTHTHTHTHTHTLTALQQQCTCGAATTNAAGSTSLYAHAQAARKLRARPCCRRLSGDPCAPRLLLLLPPPPAAFSPARSPSAAHTAGAASKEHKQSHTNTTQRVRGGGHSLHTAHCTLQCTSLRHNHRPEPNDPRICGGASTRGSRLQRPCRLWASRDCRACTAQRTRQQAPQRAHRVSKLRTETWGRGRQAA